MNKLSFIKYRTFFIISAACIYILFSVYLLIISLTDIQKLQQISYETSRIERPKSDALHNIIDNFGYGGFIDHFNKYILIRNKKNRKLSEEALDRTLSSIDIFMNLKINKFEETNMLKFKNTVLIYKDYFQKISSDANLTDSNRIKPEDLLDPYDALRAINKIHNSIYTSIEKNEEESQKLIYSLRKLAFLGFLFIIFIIFVSTYLILTIHSNFVRQFIENDNLLRLAPEAIFVSNLDGDILKYNERAKLIFEEVSGFKQTETKLNKNFFNKLGFQLNNILYNENLIHESIHPDDKIFYLNHIVESWDLQDGETSEISFRMIKADESIIWYKNKKSILKRNTLGRPSEILHSYTDITETIEYEQKLNHAKEMAEASSKAKSEFLSIMSHELRTPLNAVIGMSELIGETPLNREQLNYVRSIRIAGDTLLTLINDILDLAKIDANRLVLEINEFSLEEVCDDLVTLMAIPTNKKGLEMTYFFNPGIISYVNGDSMRLKQIILNLLGNAIKFTNSGKISFKIDLLNESENKYHVRFSVKDTGIGIPEEKLESIFEEFSQANSSTSRFYGGTGLGLALTRRFVSLMDGNISVNSTLGQGSEFVADLTFQKSGESNQRVEKIDLTDQSILIINYIEENEVYLTRLLMERGAKVDLAKTDSEAINSIISQTEKPYSFIFIDTNLPGSDYFELSKQLIELNRRDSRFIFLLSTKNLASDVEKVSKLGYPDYITKPIQRKSLQQLFNSFAQNQKLNNIHQVEKSEISLDRKLTILFVDDIEMNRSIGIDYLKPVTKIIDLAENGKEAYELYQKNKYDIIFMDMQMPDVDGFTATKLIREWENENFLPRIPIAAMTAFSTLDERDMCLKSGCDYFITKPYNRKKLFGLLDTIFKTKTI
ncbi:MAG: response regulator [Leptospiraceae bacterium]|nr:response regulator [Leptospiraceae bacterium]MCP5513153.1 response regulator [Leptospiraceae bacterium]